MFLDDTSFGRRSLPPRRRKPSPGMWIPGYICKESSKGCCDTEVGKGEPCNWCGLKEDGTYDSLNFQSEWGGE